MQLQLYTLKDIVIVVAYTLGGIIAFKTIILELSKSRKLNKIPTVGPNSWLQSWWAGRKSQTKIHELVQEGYEMYKSRPFKIIDHDRWVVVLGGRQHIEELRNVADDMLSFLGAINDVQYTMEPELLCNLYHFDVVRSRVFRAISKLYPDIREEVSVAFHEVLDLGNNDWKAVSVLGTMDKITCRVSNRAFVGLPLCRDPEWMDLCMRYPEDVIKSGRVIRRFPRFLASVVASFMTDVIDDKERAMKNLAPVIEERLKLLEGHGDDLDDKPYDLLSWLMNGAPEGKERTTKLWSVRLLAFIFSMGPLSDIFSRALFLLAENPWYIQPLREEVETVVEREGWSKGSLASMYKLDSFLRESQRLLLHSTLSMTRMAVRDFTFSDGTLIPKGTLVAVASRSRQLDEAHYENAHAFKPFRFSDLRNQESQGVKYDLVSTGADFLPFGYGKHACPARPLTALVLKSMLAHVVVSYDLKLEDGLAQSNMRSYDPTVKVMFRRRAD